MKFKTNVNTKGGQRHSLSLQKMPSLQLWGGCTQNSPTRPGRLSRLMSSVPFGSIASGRCFTAAAADWVSGFQCHAPVFFIPQSTVRYIISSVSCCLIGEENTTSVPLDKRAATPLKPSDRTFISPQ